MSKENKISDKQQNGNDFIADVISRSYTPKEVRELFIKLETERSKYYAEDANDIVPLDEWLSENGL